MSASELARHIRNTLESQADASVTDLLSLVDDFVFQYSSREEPRALLSDLEQELQVIHRDAIDHSTPFHIDLFLSVLYRLSPILAPISIISSWFDCVLRPALREPRLPLLAENYAKELIVSALQSPVDTTPSSKAINQDELRRRLFDLYLFDALNEGSGHDVLEWAELDKAGKEKRSRWKSNLEDILLRYGSAKARDLLNEIHTQFLAPSSRLQLLIFLNLYISQPSFESSAAELASHSLVSGLLLSLLLDNSSTVCTIGLTLLLKLLPILAVHADSELKSMLPSLFAILARMICWKGRTSDSVELESTSEFSAPVTDELQLRIDIGWRRLDSTFNATPTSVPSPRRYFTMLYYLFPCNLLRFFREPVQHLITNHFQSPYTVGWEKALDVPGIRANGESLLREHICHPQIVWHDATSELSQPSFWVHYDVPRITSEAGLLDVRNAILRIPTRTDASTETTPRIQPHSLYENQVGQLTHVPLPHTRNSLDDMISVFTTPGSSDFSEIVSHRSQQPPPAIDITSSEGSPHLSPPSLPGGDILVAVSALQREVLLLRNELNFEQWLSRENIKHIGRLYQDQILSKNAEAERQGLFNKLRKYRTQVVGLEKELREHKQFASSAKNKYADWNTELQKKLRELRDEKKNWHAEIAALHTAEKEAKAMFAAQGKLLEDAQREVFELQTQKREIQHKVDRLHDYERQIEQHLKMQRVWDGDFKKFNERGEQLIIMNNRTKQMEMRLESYEKSQNQLEDVARAQRLQIQALEARLSQASKASTKSHTRRSSEIQIKAFSDEKRELMKTNTKLRADNAELRDEIEELRAMVEVLKGQVSGRKGLVSDPRASPVLYA